MTCRIDPARDGDCWNPRCTTHHPLLQEGPGPYAGLARSSLAALRGSVAGGVPLRTLMHGTDREVAAAAALVTMPARPWDLDPRHPLWAEVELDCHGVRGQVREVIRGRFPNWYADLVEAEVRRVTEVYLEATRYRGPW